MKYRSIIFMALFIALGIASPFWAEALDDRYFPMDKGFSWVYDTTRKSEKRVKEHFDMQVVVEGPWQEANGSGIILTQRDKRGKMREFLVHDAKGVFISRLGISKALTPEATTRFTPPVPRVIYPLKPGTKVHWEGRLKIAWVDKPIIFDGEVLGMEEVTVPAGTFHCIKLHYHSKRGDDIVDEDAWYAEGVGQVKYDGGQYVKELKSYKPN